MTQVTIFGVKKTLLSPILVAWAPPNRHKNPKKSSLKIVTFFTLIFSWFGHGFGEVFLCFFDAFLSLVQKCRFHEKPCFSLVKSLFFKFEATKNHSKNALKTHSRKSSEKNAFLEDFGRVFGATNQWFSAFFTLLFRSTFLIEKWVKKCENEFPRAEGICSRRDTRTPTCYYYWAVTGANNDQTTDYSRNFFQNWSAWVQHT